MITTGTRVYAAGAVALGLVGVVWGDFALVWQPVPAGVPGRTALAYLFAVALIAGGVALNVRALAARGAVLLLALFTAAVVLMHGPRLLAQPAVLASWSGMAEQLVLACGAALALSLVRGSHMSGLRWRRPAQIVFGACLLVFGCAHFVYLKFTAEMVPPWLPPGQPFWAWLTGIAHVLAGVAVLTGVWARPAAILLTVMFAAFSVLVHAPALLRDLSSHLSWTINAINLALTGAAWVLADSLRTRIR